MTLNPDFNLTFVNEAHRAHPDFSQLEAPELYQETALLLASGNVDPVSALEGCLELPDKDVRWKLTSLNNTYEVGNEHFNWWQTMRAQRGIKRAAINFAASRLPEEDIAELRIPSRYIPETTTRENSVGVLELPIILKAWDNSRRDPIIESLVDRMFDRSQECQVLDELRQYYETAKQTGERYDVVAFSQERKALDPCAYSVVGRKMVAICMEEWTNQDTGLVSVAG